MVNYHYDAYGVLLQTGGTMATTLGALNPLTYRGYVYDHETGLYYLQSRYYNPTFRQFISADAYISTGQGITGYNMFAYCANNPVSFCDPGGTYRVCIEDRFKPTHAVGPPKPKLSYINDQEDENIRGMSLGLSNIKNSGCGVVASYNALIDLGCGRDFEYVLAEYNWGLGIRLYWLGLAGIRPNSVKRFFEREGFDVVSTSNYDKIDALSKTADGCILYYEWESSALIPPYYAHFFSYHRTENGYRGYNGGGLFRQPSDFLNRADATSAVGIFIFK